MALDFKTFFGDVKAQLRGVAAKLMENLPTGFKEANDKQVDDLKQSGAETQAYKAPDTAPDFTLPNQYNEPIQFHPFLEHGPVILSFHRGRWCPYCNLELRAMQKTLDQFKELGATLLAISPQTVEVTQSFASEMPLKFHVLSDKGGQVAKQFGLVYKLNDDYQAALKSVGVDLKADHGGGDDFTPELSIPATYIVAQNRKIVYAFVDADYTKRASPAELIDILKQIKQGTLA